MHRWETILIALLRSRLMTLLLMALAVAMGFNAVHTGAVTDSAASHTIALPSATEWISNPMVSFWTNTAVILAVAMLMYYINRRFNILRTTTVLYMGLFMLMTAATPSVAARLTASSLLALAVTGGVLLYFIDYNLPKDPRPVFLAGVIIGTVGLTNYAAYLFVPVMIAGLTQMRVLSMRSIMASLIGFVTPLWIAWGLGLTDVHLTIRFFYYPLSALVSEPDGVRLIAAVALTLFVGIVIGGAVLIKILSFNAKARALNGLLSIMSIYCGMLIMVNYENVGFYVTLLNCTVAFQVAHFFRLTHKRYGYITLLTLIAAYTGIYFL